MALQQKALELELGLAKLQSTPSKKQVDDLDCLLEDVYQDLQPSPQDYKARTAAVAFVDTLVRDKLSVADIRRCYGVCTARAFGSFTMDMFTSSSDLDISLNVEFGSQNLAREDGVKLLKKLTKLLYRLQSNGSVRDIQPVLKAKVPVVKFIHCNSGIECDVSVENKDGILKSELLGMFSIIDSRFRKLCFLLKAWANSQGINSSKDHTLNSLSIILLIALHLQTRVPAILPPFSMLLRGVNSGTFLNATGFVERHMSAYKNFGKKNSESVVQLLNSFLTKIVAVKDLWQDGLCASAYEGTWMLTTSPSSIYVEDFTALSQNAARAVNNVGFEAIYDSFSEALAHLKDYFLGLHDAHALKKFLFDQHVSSAVHKRKRNKGSQSKALGYQTIEGSHEDTMLRVYNSRPEEIRGDHFDILGSASMDYLGHAVLPRHASAADTGLLREHPAKRLKLQPMRNGDVYMPSLPDRHGAMPPQAFTGPHLRDAPLPYHMQRRLEVDPRYYMQPSPMMGLYEARHVLAERAAAERAYEEAWAAQGSLQQLPFYGRIPYSDAVPLYAYGARLHDHL